LQEEEWNVDETYFHYALDAQKHESIPKCKRK
jgi:hypothetical protein